MVTYIRYILYCYHTHCLCWSSLLLYYFQFSRVSLVCLIPMRLAFPNSLFVIAFRL